MNERTETLIINGHPYEVDVEVKDTLDGMFNTLEGLRVTLCNELGLDYTLATDNDILTAIRADREFIAFMWRLLWDDLSDGDTPSKEEMERLRVGLTARGILNGEFPS